MWTIVSIHIECEHMYLNKFYVFFSWHSKNKGTSFRPFFLILRAIVLFHWHCNVWQIYYPSPHVSLVIEVGKWSWRCTFVCRRRSAVADFPYNFLVHFTFQETLLRIQYHIVNRRFWNILLPTNAHNVKKHRIIKTF